MPVILISSDSYPRGREIAEKTASELGYRLIGRELLASVAEGHGVAETKLVEALDSTPSLLGMPPKVRRLYLAYIEEAVMGGLLQDKTVCYGLAAHLYVLGVSHVLKVRVLSEPTSSTDTDPEKIKKLQERERRVRRRWSMEYFRQDETDPSLYDLVISLNQLDTDEAVKIITDTAGYRRFEPMTYSLKCLHDRELTSRVRSSLVERFPDVRVRADGGMVVVETRALKREKRKKEETIREVAGKVAGVDAVEVHLINDIFREAAESYR